MNASPGPKRRSFAADATCPLDGLRVVDLSRLVAGNVLTHMLADFGAEVIKIEIPRKGDSLRDWLENGVPCHWKVYARNKKSVALDIRTAAGRGAIEKMVVGTSVFVESFRPGVMERLGLGPEALHAINPKLVIVRLTGWGQTGPYKNRPGFGSLIEGMSGFAAKNGFADRPPALPNMALADAVAGLQGAYAVMVALREVEAKGGKGQVIDLSLLEPLLSIVGPDAAEYRVSGHVKPRSGNRASITAPRNVYRTKDGRHVALSASTEDMAQRLFRAIGRADMIDDPRFAKNAARLRHVDEVDAIIQAFVGARDHDEVLSFFEREQVTFGPIYDASQIASDPHVVEREVMIDLPDPQAGYLPMHNVTPRLERTPGAIRRPAPELGQHTLEVLSQLGYDDPAIEAMRRDKTL
ncbi:MAG: CoA transferase [Azospirillum sp.]|nr:CoA transferase [Azospirillum sp.]MCA3266404.1 CoA transferase [Azospirillum sp.]